MRPGGGEANRGCAELNYVLHFFAAQHILSSTGRTLEVDRDGCLTIKRHRHAALSDEHAKERFQRPSIQTGFELSKSGGA